MNQKRGNSSLFNEFVMAIIIHVHEENCQGKKQWHFKYQFQISLGYVYGFGVFFGFWFVGFFVLFFFFIIIIFVTPV